MANVKQQLWQDAAADLRTQLFCFAGRTRFNGDFEDAFAFYFGESTDEAPPDLAQTALNRFMEWFIFDYRLDHGHRLVELFEMEHVAELDELARQLLRQWRQSHLSLLEVTSIEPDVIKAEDLVMGGRYTVSWSSEARTHVLEPRTLLIGRLLKVGNRYEAPAGMTFLPQWLCERITGWMRGEYRRYRFLRNGTWLDFLRDNGFVFHDLIDNLTELIDVEQPLQACVRAVYHPVDYAACERLLAQDADAEAVGPQRWGVKHVRTLRLPGVVGECRLSRVRFDVICPTWEDLAQAKRIVAQTLGKVVRHRVDVYERQPCDRKSGVLDPTLWSNSRGDQSAQRRFGSETGPADIAATSESGVGKADRTRPHDVYDAWGEKRPAPQKHVPLAKQCPTYLSYRQWDAVERAVAGVSRLSKHEEHADALRWIWSDYCHMANPRINRGESWAAALHVVLGRIEGWRINIDLFARLYGCKAQTVRKKRDLIWDTLQIQPFDERYCVEHPIDSIFKNLSTQYAPESPVSTKDVERIMPPDWNPRTVPGCSAYEKLILLRDLLDGYADRLDCLVGRAAAIFQRSLGGDILDSFWHQSFFDWFHFDWAIPVRGGRTILAEAAASAEWDEHAGDLQAWCDCHPNFYVLQCVTSNGVYEGTAELLLTPLMGEAVPIPVVWPMPPEAVQPGNLLFCRLVPVDGIWFNAGCALVFPAEASRDIQEQLEEEYALLGRWSGERLSWDELRAKHADRLYGLAYRMTTGFTEE